MRFTTKQKREMRRENNLARLRRLVAMAEEVTDPEKLESIVIAMTGAFGVSYFGTEGHEGIEFINDVFSNLELDRAVLGKEAQHGRGAASGRLPQ